jgi:uncharacterized membrane protein YhhN
VFAAEGICLADGSDIFGWINWYFEKATTGCLEWRCNVKTLTIILIVLLIVFSIVEIYAALTNQRQIKFVSTPVLMPLLAVIYIVSTTKRNWLIVVALALSCLGDVLNLWQSSEDIFMIEIGAFLLALICYTIVFQRPISHHKLVPLGVHFLSIVYIAYGVLIYFLLRPNLGDMEIPSIVYLIIVLVMSFSALTRIAKSNSYLYWLPFIGSLFFIASDTCLAFNVFKYNGQMQYGDFLTTITYLPAQFLIVFGLTYASPKQAP